jgi:hypothetical protein
MTCSNGMTEHTVLIQGQPGAETYFGFTIMITNNTRSNTSEAYLFPMIYHFPTMACRVPGKQREVDGALDGALTMHQPIQLSSDRNSIDTGPYEGEWTPRGI